MDHPLDRSVKLFTLLVVSLELSKIFTNQPFIAISILASKKYQETCGFYIIKICL